MSRNVIVYMCCVINLLIFLIIRLKMADEGDKTQGMKVLGILDIQNTPCARDSILHGAGGSLVTGLLHFLATSRVKRSFDIGVAGFMVTTLGSWFYCRYNNAKLRVQQRVIQEGIKNKVIYEGTNLDPMRKTRGDA